MADSLASHLIQTDPYEGVPGIVDPWYGADPRQCDDIGRINDMGGPALNEHSPPFVIHEVRTVDLESCIGVEGRLVEVTAHSCTKDDRTFMDDVVDRTNVRAAIENAGNPTYAIRLETEETLALAELLELRTPMR